jgi:V8-like Glu-specific endopeptidase
MEFAVMTTEKAAQELTEVRDTKRAPLNAICRLIGEDSICTAVAIGRRTLLTVGHNLASQNPDNSIWTVFPAYNRTDVYPKVAAIKEIPYPPYAASADPELDIGLIRVAADLPASFAFSRWRPGALAKPVYVSGYCEDHSKVQTFSEGALLGEIGNLVAHSCQTKPGHSGSPIFTTGPEGARLVAMHAYGPGQLFGPAGQSAVAVKLTDDIYDWIASQL